MFSHNKNNPTVPSKAAIIDKKLISDFGLLEANKLELCAFIFFFYIVVSPSPLVFWSV